MKQPNISARRVIVVSFLVDLSDIVLNLGMAAISGSVVMVSQALQGAADLTTSGLLLIGSSRSNRRANRLYPFGYGRELFVWTLAAGVSMFVVTGGASVIFGFNRFLHPEPITNVPASLLVLMVGLATNLYALRLSWRRLFRAQPKHKWQRLLHSGMVETKTTLFLDLMGSIAAIFGLISLSALLVFQNNRFDGVGAILTGATTIGLAIFLIRDAKSLLVGRGATRETKELIRQTAVSVKGVSAVEDLRTMFIGSAQLLVNLEVNLEPQLHTREIELIIDEIKRKIQKKVPTVEYIQVELESHVS